MKIWVNKDLGFFTRWNEPDVVADRVEVDGVEFLRLTAERWLDLKSWLGRELDAGRCSAEQMARINAIWQTLADHDLA